MEIESNALKTIAKTEDELRVGNYIVVFGGRDLTGVVQMKNKDGSAGEYFTADTDLESYYTKSNHVLVDWEHGLDPDGVGITSDDELGYVDWKTAKKDERGVFVERVLNRRNQYMQWLEELVDAGLIGNSTQTTREAKRADNGEIVKWPLRRDTLTVNPMEPRMLTENMLTAVKSLADKMPALKSLILDQAEAANRAAPISVKDIVSTKPLEVKTMEITEEKLAELLQTAATKAVEMAQPATAKAGIVVTKDEADQPFEKVRDFFTAVKSAALGQGESVKLRSLKATGMSEGNPADGGYLIPPQFSAGILENMYSTGQILSRVAQDPVTGNTMSYNAVDETSRATGSRKGGIRGYWLAEGSTLTKSKPTFRQVELKLKKEGVLTYATDEQLEDTANLESWLMRTVPEELQFLAEDAIFEGDGVGKPWGIMNAPALVTVTRVDGSKVQFADLVAMWARRNVRGKYVWLINQDVNPQLDQLILASSTEIPTRFIGINDQGVTTIKGAPVIEVEYASTLGTVGDIVLADLSQYQTITKGGVRSASSMHVQFTTDEMTYRFIYRLDGAPIWSSPVTPFKGTNTVSPFVALSSST